MNLYLVPGDRANVAATIQRKVPLETLSGRVETHEEQEINKMPELNNGFHCWAFAQGRSGQWNRMQVGDIVLISPTKTGEFQFAGKMMYKLQSERLGNKLWPFVNKKPWKHIYLLGSLTNIDLDKRKMLTEDCGYSPQFELPGPILVKDDHLRRLLSTYESLEDFWEHISGGPSPITPDSEQSFTIPRPVRKQQENPSYSAPLYLDHVISAVKELKGDSEHKERGHESLVEKFFEALGYKPVSEIKFRKGFVDIQIQINGRTIAVIEVKANWNLSRHEQKVLKQAFGYAMEHGRRVVVITNGDYYAIFDRFKGLSFEEDFVGEFSLTRLTRDCMAHINWLKSMREL